MRKLVWISSMVVSISLLTTIAFAKDDCLISSKRNGKAFQDTQGIWCEASIDTCYRTGILEGVTQEHFYPHEQLTYAQITVIAARLQSLLAGGTGEFRKAEVGEAWYMPAYQSLKLTSESNSMVLPDVLVNALESRPGDPCTRKVFVEALSAALELSSVDLPEINNVTILPDDSDKNVLEFYRAGVLNGMDSYGAFRGTTTLNRGQAAAMIARIVDPKQRLKFELDEFNLIDDVFRLDPEMVLFSDGDTDYTILQFAAHLGASIQGAEQQGHINQQSFFENLILPFCYEYTAPRLLADNNEIQLTDEELKVIQDAAHFLDGYKGLPYEFWVWNNTTELIVEKLKHHYIQNFGVDEFGQPNRLYLELGMAAKEHSIEFTMEVSPLEIDLSGIAHRLKNIPSGLTY